MNPNTLLIILLPVTFAFPLPFTVDLDNDQQIDPQPPESNERQFDHRLVQNPDFFEGDIATPLDEYWRNAVPSDEQLWPLGVIPYVIDASLNDIKEHIDAALGHIQNRTCIKFKKRTTEKDYVKYFSGNGCFASAAGRKGDQQTVSIGKGCDFYGIIVHETMHAIGFHHMHTRSDRDKFLDIFWENIAEDYKPQFTLQSPQELRFLTPFDYDSIMMYGPTTGSKDDKSITMLPVNRTITLIDASIKPGLSDYDVEAVNKLYKCQQQFD